MKARVHRQELDPSQPKLLMALDHFILPPWLRGINRQEPHQRVRMFRDIVGDVAIIDPQTAELGFAAKYHGDGVVRGRAAVLIVMDGQVEFRAGFGTSSLTAEVVAEMERVLPRMTMDVEDHDVLQTLFDRRTTQEFNRNHMACSRTTAQSTSTPRPGLSVRVTRGPSITKGFVTIRVA